MYFCVKGKFGIIVVMPTSRVIGLLLTGLVAAAEAAESSVNLAAPEPLRSVANVRSLTPEQASANLPVQLRGVVTFAFDPHSCFIQDQSAGIFVGNGVEAPPLSAGDIVALEGATDPGDYAPIVKPSRVTLLGRTNLPPATRVSFADLMTGYQDSQWVEVLGLVRAADTAPAQLSLEIDMGGGRVTVFPPNMAETELMRLVDSTVRVRGVCGTWFNKQRQLFGVRLMVSRAEDIVVEEPAAADAFAQPSQPIGSLLRFAPQGAYGHMVKVDGTVVLQQPGR